MLNESKLPPAPLADLIGEDLAGKVFLDIGGRKWPFSRCART